MVVNISEPLISVIVPIYNVEAYLERCLDSLVAQTYSNIEIILIDDGSTDYSGAIADKYAKIHSNIIVIHKPNGGLSSARNVGLELARGEWIAFVDSDDFVNKDFISKLFELAIENNTDIATCSNSSISYDNTPTKSVSRWPSVVLTGNEAIRQSFIHRWTPDVWLNLFKTSLFRENGIIFPEGREYESVAAKIKLLFFARKIAFTNEKLYCYVGRHDSITHKKFSWKNYEDKLAAIDELKAFLEENDDNNKVSIYFNYYAFRYQACIINQLSLEHASCENAKRIWQNTRRRLLELYPNLVFPSLNSRIACTAILSLSTSRRIYQYIYNPLAKLKHLNLSLLHARILKRHSTMVDTPILATTIIPDYYPQTA